MVRVPLGIVLRARKSADHLQIEQALDGQKRYGGQLGDIMVSQGHINYLELYQALAQQQGLLFVDLLNEKPDNGLLAVADIADYLRLRVLPYGHDEISGITRVAACDISPAVKQWAATRFGEKIEWAITSPVDIRRAVEECFGHVLESRSRLMLWQRLPLVSARQTLLPLQRVLLALLAGILIGSVLLWPLQSVINILLFCHVLYALTNIAKAFIFSCGLAKAKSAPLPDMDEALLPCYTVLIPMYREAESVSGILEAMRMMDYPPSKMDIKLVCEHDDDETLAAAYALKPRYQFEIIKVPAGTPRTKPRACNYALHFARGEYITVFDADDRPDPLQLKKAVAAFRSLPEHIICLQARLGYYNSSDNLLTRFFALEYHGLFHVMLHGLQRLRIPIPLGGTSNHMALARMRELGEWDPYNVTEDADLGVRLAARGYATAMLDSYTLEEAPNRLGAWLRQRSRWIKGYMQTWLVHMRAPGQLFATLGLRGFLGFQFFVGFSSFAFLTAPLLWGVVALWGVDEVGMPTASHLPDWFMEVTIVNLLLNLLINWGISFSCAFSYRRSGQRMAPAAALYPLYMMLHSLASYKALWQLIFRPHFWEKTMHGRAKSFIRPPVQ